MIRKLLLAAVSAIALASSPALAQTSSILKLPDNTGPVTFSTASAKLSISTATTTQVVALTAAKRILVTSFNFHSAGTTTFKFVYGTGTNCGTGTTDLTDIYDLVASDGMTSGNGAGVILFVPAGNALCIFNSAAVHVGGSLAYDKR